MLVILFDVEEAEQKNKIKVRACAKKKRKRKKDLMQINTRQENRRICQNAHPSTSVVFSPPFFLSLLHNHHLSPQHS
jgi:hypothetical protein